MADATPPEDSLAGLIAVAQKRLVLAGIETPDLDARLLGCGACGIDPAGLIVHGGRRVDGAAAARLAGFIDRRAAGEPVHRILGRRAFFAHDFALSPETLEPRPDTESLVALAASAVAGRFAADAPFLFADVGTGSGAIGVSLLALFPRSACLAVDLSEGALRTARLNAVSADVAGRFWPVACDTLSAVGAPLDLIVSNPPYIPSGDIDELAREVRLFDPRLALDGGPDGLDVYRRLAGSACVLSAGGDILVEIGIGQKADVEAIFKAAGFSLTTAADDLSGTVRALWFRRPGPENATL